MKEQQLLEQEEQRPGQNQTSQGNQCALDDEESKDDNQFDMSKIKEKLNDQIQEIKRDPLLAHKFKTKLEEIMAKEREFQLQEVMPDIAGRHVVPDLRYQRKKEQKQNEIHLNESTENTWNEQDSQYSRSHLPMIRAEQQEFISLSTMQRRK